MTSYYISAANSIDATLGDGLDVAAGDSVYIAADGHIFSGSAGFGVYDPSYGYFEVHGVVSGEFGGIRAGAAGVTTSVLVGQDGHVHGGFYAAAIAIIGAHYIVNLGDVAGTYAVVTTGQGTTVNQGWVLGAYGVFDDDYTVADTNYVYNYAGGLIDTSNHAYVGGLGATGVFVNLGFSHGAIYFGNGANDQLYNSGEMVLTAISGTDGAAGASFYDGVAARLVNMGEIKDGDGRFFSPVTLIQFGNGAGDTVFNYGTIEQLDLQPGSISIAFGAGSGDYVYNDATGTIQGAIVLGSGAGQSVYNNGVINGGVTLGDGASELYYGPQGTMNGAIVCGSGGDYVFTGSDVETVFAGLGDDYFSAGAGGATVLHETAAAQQSNGWDWVANFQTATGAPNVGTYIYIDPAFAGTTNFVAYNGGALIQMALGGGLYSYIDVLGASVASVQAQTYFA